MEVVLFACARSSTLDARTNNISLFHILESVSSPTFPIVLPPFVAVTMLARNPDESETPKLTMKWNLNDEPIFEFPLEINFQGQSRARNLTDIEAVLLQGPGILTATVFLEESWEVE
jgi:hypothetical protein